MCWAWDPPKGTRLDIESANQIFSVSSTFACTFTSVSHKFKHVIDLEIHQKYLAIGKPSLMYTCAAHIHVGNLTTSREVTNSSEYCGLVNISQLVPGAKQLDELDCQHEQLMVQTNNLIVDHSRFNQFDEHDQCQQQLMIRTSNSAGYW